MKEHEGEERVRRNFSTKPFFVENADLFKPNLFAGTYQF